MLDERERVMNERLAKVENDAKTYQRFRESPEDFFNDPSVAGQVDTARILKSAMAAGTPEAEMERLRRELTAAKEEASKFTKWQQEQQQKRQEEQAAQQRAANAEQAHRTFIAKASELPTLKRIAAEDAEWLIGQAYMFERRFVSQQKRGPTLDEIAQGLEAQYSRLVGAPQSAQSEAAAASVGNAKTVRTVSTSDAAQRTSAPLSSAKLTEAERRRRAEAEYERVQANAQQKANARGAA